MTRRRRGAAGLLKWRDKAFLVALQISANTAAELVAEMNNAALHDERRRATSINNDVRYHLSPVI